MVGAVLLAGLLAAACSGVGSGDGDGTVLVFAAASLSDAFGEVAEAFEDRNPGASVQLNFAGSSGLREQILDGAPASVFASANAATMADLDEAEALADTPVTFARNSLTIAVPPSNPAAVSGLEDFAQPDLLVGICAAGVPCGDLARTVLDNAGVEPALDTEEPDVRALLTKVVAGELDAGIVYRTDIASAAASAAEVPIPAELNQQTEYQIAVVAEAGDSRAARQFVEFVASPEAQAILASHGFDAP